MDLIGKYLGIWVNRDEIVEIFGLHPASTAKVFIVGGEVIGAIPALGLFMRLDTVAVQDGVHELCGIEAGAVEVRAAQVRLFQAGVGKVSIAQAGATQIGSHQNGVAQDRAVQPGKTLEHPLLLGGSRGQLGQDL